jgi:hypothetical protein
MNITCSLCEAEFKIKDGNIPPEPKPFRIYEARRTKVGAPDKRFHKRVEVHNLVSCVCLNEDERPIHEFMAVALDISRGGLLLESIQDAAPGKALLISVDDQNEIIEVKGRIVYCRRSSVDKFSIGVAFSGSQVDIMRFVKGLIRAHHQAHSVITFLKPAIA